MGIIAASESMAITDLSEMIDRALSKVGNVLGRSSKKTPQAAR
ncbi:MAG: hypothetical protein ACREF3_17645 [Acetobacteraceae bacterium]